ncbi:MAG: glycosyltransferase [Elusimicrobia bacterium]|nr:glycosyltransferase [Candidatus Liberimonas magnetica]
MNYDVSIIITSYNEENLLEAGVNEIIKVMEQSGYSHELIFIDDCSSDKTRYLILKLVKDKPNRSYVFHEINVGRGGTINEGIKLAKGKIVGYLDIDLEVHARNIPVMIHAIKSGNDIATAFRVYKISLAPYDILRYILSIGYRKLLRLLLKTPLHDTEAGCKFFSREKILPLIDKTQNKRWFWDTEIMTLSYLSGLKIVEIPCQFIRRLDKISSINLFKDIRDDLLSLLEFKNTLKDKTK